MNFLKLAENLGLDEDEFVELVELFIETGSSDLIGLKGAIEKKDVEEIIVKSHSIKGASGNLGFMNIYDLAKKVEDGARDGVVKCHEHAVDSIEEEIFRINRLLTDRS